MSSGKGTDCSSCNCDLGVTQHTLITSNAAFTVSGLNRTHVYVSCTVNKVRLTQHRYQYSKTEQ